MDSVVWHGSAVHPRLSIQEVLTLAIDVVYDGLPAEGVEKGHQAEKRGGHWIIKNI